MYQCYLSDYNTAPYQTMLHPSQLVKRVKAQRLFLKFLPKCHFVTYYSHFRVLGNLANISVLNRGKTALENGNFDYWSLYSKLEKLESQDVLTMSRWTIELYSTWAVMIRQSRRKRKFDKEKERLIHTVL